MEETTETTPDTEPASPDTPDTDTTDAPDTTPESRNLSREAAAYRHKAKAAREELEALQVRYADLQSRYEATRRESVNRHLPEHVAPELFWQFAEQGDALIEAEGDVLTEMIAEEVARLEKRFNLHPVRPHGPIVPMAGEAPDLRPAARTRWDNIIKGTRPDL